MEKQNNCNVIVVWRGMKLSVDVNSNSNVKEFGQKLQELTHVKPDTMRLFVPQTNNKGSRMLSPFSDAHSMLSMQEAAILQGKPIRMMGVLKDEIDEVSQNSKNNLRIVGFDEEEKRLKQRATYRPQPSLKLPQGNYIFCEFRTLQIPGIQLTPPPSEALKRMHMLACDPGIIAIMNKHRWRVGIMTEMAPEGYVGISPKCILGFNKNHGEEISLRLRTDDLQGFRKYESIKKTLLHELAHMVFSEHDSNFFALNKQLNEEAASLDWTKSSSRTLNGRKYTDNYEEDAYIDASRESIGQKLGGQMNSFASARASSVAAAYHRLVNVLAKEPLLDDNKSVGNQGSFDSEPDPDDMATSLENASIVEMVEYPKASFSKSYTVVHGEPDHDDSLNNENVLEPDPDDAPTISVVAPESKTVPVDIAATENEHDPENSQSVDAAKTIMRHDPAGILSNKLDTQRQKNLEPGPDESTSRRIILDVQMEELSLTKLHGEPDPDESTEDMLSEAQERLQQSTETSPVAHNSMQVDDAYGLDNQEVQRIEEPAAVFCSRLQKAIDILKSEATPSQAATVLQTLFKIIRNVIEHPGEIKFRRLRKANPQFQRNVANYKAAMEVLALVGFCEDVISGWLDGECRCATTAGCTRVRLPPSSTGGREAKGFRCSCREGFVGDGFAHGDGCRRVEKRGASRSVSGSFRDGSKVGVLVGAIAAGVSLLLGLALLCRRIRQRRPATICKGEETTQRLLSQTSCAVAVYSLKDVLCATSNFSDASKIGAGAYATVYVGKFSQTGLIAIKRLKHPDVDNAEHVIRPRSSVKGLCRSMPVGTRKMVNYA